VERSFAWLGRNRRLSKDYEYMVQTSETLIDIAAIRIMLNRLAPADASQTASQPLVFAHRSVEATKPRKALIGSLYQT